MNHPVMYALAHLHEQEVWFDVQLGVDSQQLEFSCLFPTKEVAEMYQEKMDLHPYTIVPVTVVRYHMGVTAFEYHEPDTWKEDEADEDLAD